MISENGWSDPRIAIRVGDYEVSIAFPRRSDGATDNPESLGVFPVGHDLDDPPFHPGQAVPGLRPIFGDERYYEGRSMWHTVYRITAVLAQLCPDPRLAYDAFHDELRRDRAVLRNRRLDRLAEEGLQLKERYAQLARETYRLSDMSDLSIIPGPDPDEDD